MMHLCITQCTYWTPLNSCIKQLLSDGFNIATIKISNEEPWPSNVVMHIKTVILLGNFSFGLINFVNLSTTNSNFYSTFLIVFFIKNASYVFYFWGQHFLHLCFMPIHVADCLVRANGEKQHLQTKRVENNNGK